MGFLLFFFCRTKMAERPKRPLSAYMLWLNDSRESIKRENPGIKVTEVAKRGGELWRALKDKSVSVLLISLRYSCSKIKTNVCMNLRVSNSRCQSYHKYNNINFFFNFILFSFLQKWEQKAVEAKENYNRALKTFEANGGGKDSGAGKKRSKGGRAKPAKKGKKKADSEDDDEDESD